MTCSYKRQKTQSRGHMRMEAETGVGTAEGGSSHQQLERQPADPPQGIRRNPPRLVPSGKGARGVGCTECWPQTTGPEKVHHSVKDTE